MTSSSQPSQHGVVSAEETGRSCPYCRFPLKQGIEMVRCGVCAAPHHADCWADNGGCAVIACTDGPQAHPGAAAPEVPVAAPPPLPQPPTVAQPVWQQQPMPPPPAPAAPPPAGSPGPRRTGPWIVAAAIGLALLLAGGAFAVVLSSKGSSPTTRTIISVQQADDSVPSEPTTPVETTTEEVPTAPASASAAAVPPNDESTRQDIEQVLREHHEDLVSGDYRGAWDLMTKRKQAQKLNEDGYPRWAEDQARALRPYLSPSGLHATVEAIDPLSGVARVFVTGMGWSRPGSSCSEFSGVTWVKFEDGAWRYDPGYSTTSERRRIWEPRSGELLGWGC